MQEQRLILSSYFSMRHIFLFITHERLIWANSLHKILRKIVLQYFDAKASRVCNNVRQEGDIQKLVAIADIDAGLPQTRNSLIHIRRRHTDFPICLKGKGFLFIFYVFVFTRASTILGLKASFNCSPSANLIHAKPCKPSPFTNVVIRKDIWTSETFGY